MFLARASAWSIQFRAAVRRAGQDQILRGEVITHTQQQVQDRTGNGWDVVPPPVEAPAPQN